MSREIFHYCFEIPEFEDDALYLNKTVSQEILDSKITNLMFLKKKIDGYYDSSRKYNIWNCMSRDLHPYESIVQKYNINSISRAFFKLFEMLYSFNIKLPNNNTNLYLCEAPGGFIQASSLFFKGLIDKYISVSIDSNIKYHKEIKNNAKIDILIDDITNENTIDWILNKCPDQGFSLITADGAFDVSADYEKQEIFTYDLLFNEISISLATQRPGGTLIIKLFDCIHTKTWSLILWLKRCYKQVFICKPPSSRPVNSERYCICLGFIEHKYYCPWIILAEEEKLHNFRNYFLWFTLAYQIKNLEKVFAHIKIKEEANINPEKYHLDQKALSERISLSNSGEEKYSNIYGDLLKRF
jgi:23S rRNA U2552 (ribose-2'-O)-methylase RlmE/FtsJ|tara:strand:+ start:1458 stop:2525 length:1068 start_codon:yes stop_codon:yes gene_type:complete